MRRRRKKCPFTNLFLELKSFWSFVEDERQGTFNDVRGPEFCLRRGIIQMLLTKKKEILVTGSRVYRELDNRANKTRRTAGINRFRSDYVCPISRSEHGRKRRSRRATTMLTSWEQKDGLILLLFVGIFTRCENNEKRCVYGCV